jgi:hypothetical protein
MGNPALWCLLAEATPAGQGRATESARGGWQCKHESEEHREERGKQEQYRVGMEELSGKVKRQ